MLRIGLIAALALLLVPASPAAAAGAASVTLTGCTPKERTAAFEARMDQIAGAERMKLRYSLEARKPGRAWHRRGRARARRLARRPPTETTRFISERRVTQLIGPSYYRAMVRFRWIDEDGARSPAPGRARAPAGSPTTGRTSSCASSRSRARAPTSRWSPTPAAARPAPSTWQITGLPPIVVAELAPGEERLIEAAGPECEPGTPVTATADPLDLIDERNERDNAVTRRCPSARAS